jgi:aryl-alcohol dehydrogenase
MAHQITAAVCRATDAPFTLEQLSLDDPRADEVLVRICGSGICHTDLAVRDQQLPTPLPVVLGHEGAGVVEAVGAGVTHVKPGDRVLMSFNSCGECPCCHSHSPTYCYNFFPHNFAGARADGSATLHGADGEVVHGNFFGQSSFATLALASARNVVKVPDAAAHIPLHMLSPLGCGMMTGAGAVLRSMKVEAGMPIAIFGAGAVGLAAVMAAKIAGANPIIAVDLHENRLALARELGATHTCNGREDPLGQIAALCPQGLAYAFDNTGLASIIEGVFPLIAPKGILGLVGASAPDAMLSFNETSLMGGGKRVIGILGGDSDLHGFLPELIEHHVAGRFPYDRLIQTFPFAQINEAVHAGESGAVVKPVLVMEG